MRTGSSEPLQVQETCIFQVKEIEVSFQVEEIILRRNTNTRLGYTLLLALALLVAGCHTNTGGGQAPAVAYAGGPCFGSAPCYDNRGVLVDHLGRRYPGQRRR